MVSENVSELKKFAFYSRFVLLIFQFIINVLIPDHDAGVFLPPQSNDSILDAIVETLIGGLRRWDAVYFMNIAEHGYLFENMLAFFPLFPTLSWLIANSVLYPLTTFISLPHVLLMGAIFLNFYLFIKCAEYIYLLGCEVMGDYYCAYFAALFFCVNPASVFMSAAYSETLYTCITLKGLLFLEKQKTVKSSIIFGLSGLTRSNGLLNFGFVLYRKFEDVVKSAAYVTEIVGWRRKVFYSLSVIALTLSTMLCCLVLILLPWISYQYYVYNIFCIDVPSWKTIFGKAFEYFPLLNQRNTTDSIVLYGVEQGLKFSWNKSRSPWCYYLLPVSYSYIQEVYWNVGFMRYYQLKQIPNFLLAAPVILLSINAVLSYVKIRKRFVFTLGIIDRDYVTTNTDADNLRSGYYNDRCYPYIVHLFALLVFGVLFMHIQVLTRFLFSSCPVLYWYVSLITRRPASSSSRRKKQHQPLSQTDYNINRQGSSRLDSHVASAHEFYDGDKNRKTNSTLSQLLDRRNNGQTAKLVCTYFFIYYFVGTAMHVNFLPWT